MICIDSNIIIYSARLNREPLRQWLSQQDLAVSIISRIEVLGYHSITQAEIDMAIHYFSLCKVLPLTDAVADLAIQLKQQKSMSAGDAIIAASSFIENIPLATANTKDFKHIKELVLIGLDEIMG